MTWRASGAEAAANSSSCRGKKCFDLWLINYTESLNSPTRVIFISGFMFIAEKNNRQEKRTSFQRGRSGAMKMKVLERRDNITLRLFKSKWNEIHLDSQTSQVITGGDFFFFYFSLPGDWFLTRCRKAWKSLSHNHFGLRQKGSRWRKRRWARLTPPTPNRQFIIMLWFISLVSPGRGCQRESVTMKTDTCCCHPENSCCRDGEEEEFSADGASRLLSSSSSHH